MGNPTAKPFSDERIAPIIANFRAVEYESGITNRQIVTAQNLAHLANFRQQFVAVDVEGMERMSFHDPDTWVEQEVEAYLYYELINQNEEINLEKLREQVFYRIIKNKLHVGIRPGAEFEVSISKNEDSTDCLIKIEYYANSFCPKFHYFVGILDKMTEIIEESLISPNSELTYEEVESFLVDGEEKKFYNNDDYEDDSANHYDDDYRDDDEGKYRSRSMEDQGYNDYDYIHGGGGYDEDEYEPEYDEDEHLDHQVEKRNERISPFFYYASVIQNPEDNEILLQE